MKVMSAISRRIFHPLWAIRDSSPRLRYLADFERTQWLGQEQVHDKALESLRAMLVYAAERVPYYRDLATRHHLRPTDVHSVDDFARWPILTKSDIQQHHDELVAEGWPRDDLQSDFTGGSTGSPLRFIVPQERRASREAGAWRHDRWAGWELGEVRAILWGASRDFPQRTWRQLLRNALLDRFLPLDAMTLTVDAMGEYLRELHRYRPVVLQAYAQSARIFAEYLRAHGLEPPPLRGVISTAEVLSPEDREIIETAFQCRVYNRYGCREVGLIASQCAEGRYLHINAESVFVEFVRGQNPVAPGEPGEILITDLRNYAMPLIRYRIGDIGARAMGVCSCGRGLPLMEMVAGRITDFVVRPDFSLASGIALCTYLITEIPGLAQVQIVQPSLKQLVFRVVPTSAYSRADLDILRIRAERYLGFELDVSFELVREIPREPSGKYRFTISHVSPGFIPESAGTRPGVSIGPRTRS